MSQTTKAKVAAVLTGLAVAIGGCGPATSDVGPGESVERTSSELLFFFPLPRFLLSVDLVGRGLNGMSLNGKALDDRMLTEVSLKSVRMADGKKKNLDLTATSFTGSKLDLAKSRKEMVGATFAGILDDGDSLLLRVTAVEPSTGTTPFLRYAVAYPADGAWQPLCGLDDAGAAVLAIPLEGTWDYRQGVEEGGSWNEDDKAFTFACEGFVLAKCVDMGYAPWIQGKMCIGDQPKMKCRQTSLAAHHQACARMLRADFCGDGSSYTSDGTWVNAYDGLGIRNDSENWPLEAEWDANGARCAVRERLHSAGFEPPCMDRLASPDCGDLAHFEKGTLVISESAGANLP